MHIALPQESRAREVEEWIAEQTALTKAGKARVEADERRLQTLGEELLAREKEVAALKTELSEELARAQRDSAAAAAERSKLQVRLHRLHTGGKEACAVMTGLCCNFTKFRRLV